MGSGPLRWINLKYNISKYTFSYGERSSVGRAPDCDSGRRGFESHRSPHFFGAVSSAGRAGDS